MDIGAGWPRRATWRLVARVESCLDRALPATENPLRQAGALGCLFFAVVVASGVYLFVFLDTGDPYASVEYMTRGQWYLAGVMRSLHRYASDALVVALVVHALREWALDRHRGARAFTWLTGVTMTWLLLGAGVSGYWLVWDELAQWVAIATSEWLDGLGIFGEPIARNFASPQVLSGRFFTLLVFLHVLVPLLSLLALWLHVQRLAAPRVVPPRRLAAIALAALAVLSLVRPAGSHPPADLARLPGKLAVDWFYLAPLAALDALGAGGLWAAAAGGTLLLVLLPWLPRVRRPAAAVVDAANCNGCARCVADCPFTALRMVGRRDDSGYSQIVEVDAGLCTGCGLCMGACPTATPFRRRSDLHAGIEVPAPSLQALRARIDAARGAPAPGAVAAQGGSVLVVRCAGGAAAPPGVAVLEVPCMGTLPPPFVDYALAGRFGGVVFAACHDGACRYRLGDAVARGRIAGTRDPVLRRRVDRGRLAYRAAGAAGAGDIAEAVARLRSEAAPPVPPAARGGRMRPALQLLFAVAGAMAIVALSGQPMFARYAPDTAMLTLSFSHATARRQPCRTRSIDELARLSPHMRSPQDCARGRVPLHVELRIDGKVARTLVVEPGGLAGDGPAAVYARVPLAAGRHHVALSMRDTARADGFDHRFEREFELAPRRNATVDFRPDAGGFFVHGEPADRGSTAQRREVVQ
jgi:ferredoxin/coenzyme F420-reducing hydrogenase delta subunit